MEHPGIYSGAAGKGSYLTNYSWGENMLAETISMERENETHTCIHSVQYYETYTHHSNEIRWMEETWILRSYAREGDIS